MFENDLDVDLKGGDDDHYDDEGHKKAKSDDREVDVYWRQAQREKREREERDKRMAAEQKVLGVYLRSV